MSFFDSVKKFFDFQKPEGNTSIPSDNHSFYNDRENRDENFGFNVFSNPLEMQRYFEREMENIMKSFGFPNSFFGSIDSFGNAVPSIQDENDQESNGQQKSLREHYLKPGFEKKSKHPECDTDIDGKLDMGQIETMLRHSDTQTTPYTPEPKIRFYGQSVSTSIVTKPDGSIETRKTMVDKNGNKETTVNHKFGEKEYTITTKVDKNGKQEVIENFVNMDENEAKNLMARTNRNDVDLTERDPHWNLFEKFFK